MQSEQGTEGAILEPADDEFTKSRRLWVATMEASNIGGPPGNATQTHVQARTHLCL